MCCMIGDWSETLPFALLLLPDSLLLSLSLCRCPCLFAGFQSLAVFFCLSPGLFPASFPLFPSFFFLQTPHKQYFCTHSVRATPNHLTSKSLLPICDNRLITNLICSTTTRFCSHFKRYFSFSLLFASFLFLQVLYNQHFCTHSVRATPNHLQTSTLSCHVIRICP